MYENYAVLFVDDEVNILNSLRRGLIDEEYTCYFANSGKEALDIMNKTSISVIVSDMRMPEMDGLHLLRLVKEQWPNTVAIVLSGYTQLPQILTTINQVDIFKFITKPWNLEEEFKGVIFKALDYYILIEKNEESKKSISKRNEAYQNIFRNIDAVMEQSKRSCFVLGVLGKTIFEYNRLHKEDISENFYHYENLMYDLFIDALTGEQNEVTGDKFATKTLEYIQSKIKVISVDNKLDPTLEIKYTPSIVEATLESCIELFGKEYSEAGLLLTFGRISDQSITISLISKEILKSSSIKKAEEKLTFLDAIIKDTLKNCKIDFKILINKERLMIFITLYSQNIVHES